MIRTSDLANGVAAVVIASTAALAFGPTATADPAAPPLPNPTALLPGMPALEQLSPVIQQAAANPGSAASMLMAAAAAFAGNTAAPTDSKQVADSVTQFVQAPAGLNLPGTDSPPAAAPGNPSAHLPAAGATPGSVAHLPTGINPANVVGPAPQQVPPPAEAAAPQPAPAPTPETAPASATAPAFSPDSPPTQDFMYPSIGSGCLVDGGNSIATALSVAGPAAIPTPGPGPGQTAYVFTAVGTPGPADVQKLPLNVTWVNLTTGKSGTTTLKPHADINPDGPTTLTAIVDTGSGSVMSTIFGQVSTKDKQCQFMPTIGSTVVP